MSRMKIFCGVFAVALIFFSSILCSAATEDSANAKLARIEIDTYGAEQTGAILDRISRLEKSYNGQNTVGNMNARIDAIYDALYDNSAGPCVLAKINVLEWNINREVRSDGVDKRLESLELAILGNTTQGTFNERIRALAKASFGEEILPVIQVQVPANLLIKVETTAPVSSKTMQEGDVLPFRVVEDVYVNGKLVFVRGLPGRGNVVKVLRAKNIFSNGKIEADFHTLKTIDGQSAVTFTGVEALDEMKKFEMARGLSLNGQTFSGKTGDIEEVFIRGKNIELDAGVEMYIQIKEPLVVYALNTKNDQTISAPVNNPQPVLEINPPPVTENPPPPVMENPPSPVTENPPYEIIDDGPEGLSDDEKIATPPPPPPVTETKPVPPNGDEEIIEIYDDEETPAPPPKPVEESKPAPKNVEESKPAPKNVEESKPAPKNVKESKPAPVDGNDVEVIEIYDE